MKAEALEKSQKVPVSMRDKAQEVSETCIKGFEHANAGHPVLAERLADDGPGIHAYCYQECDDDSVVALYANTPDGEIKIKAFDSLQAASRWSPRDER